MSRARAPLAAVSLAALALAGSTDPALAKKSRPADREKAVRLAHELESDPLCDDGPQKRKWLIDWLSKVSDITVNVRDLLGPVPNKSYPYSPQLTTQMIFSNAAFVIEHPDRANDEVAAQTAGLEGALDAYQAILRGNPDARLAFFDDLIARREAGTLGDYVRQSIAEQSDR
jgi:hypothetical protein